MEILFIQNNGKNNKEKEEKNIKKKKEIDNKATIIEMKKLKKYEKENSSPELSMEELYMKRIKEEIRKEKETNSDQELEIPEIKIK